MIWMISQGIAIAPPTLATQEPNSAVAGADGAKHPKAPLVLASPDSFTSYQIHPGLPAENQRIQVAGYATDGKQWHRLRLVIDGKTVQEASDATRVDAWWEIVEGQHQFWLEGERSPSAASVRSSPSLVKVDPFQQNHVQLTSVR